MKILRQKTPLVGLGEGVWGWGLELVGRMASPWPAAWPCQDILVCINVKKLNKFTLKSLSNDTAKVMTPSFPLLVILK